MSRLAPMIVALTERPEAIARPDFRAALEEFDFWQLSDQDDADRTAGRRRGISHPPKSETIRRSAGMDRQNFLVCVSLPAAAE
ncbi:hypothetical protein [Rhizobium sp. R634]|uniref:hypothetical protein n=1 Tax=Rhizobium sp. R634 TaxID=1764274 RepID=UPI000B52E687|nr:hypothetical protein [Rhizobium sp. R634]